MARPGYQGYWKGWFSVAGGRYGLEYSRVGLVENTPYLDRWILYFGRWCLRLHKFWRGDEDRAPHDHPFDFWTFPLTGYAETRYSKTGHERGAWTVQPFRWHYRSAEFRHIVRGRADGLKKPFYTIVVARLRVPKRTWGFYPKNGGFVPWMEWPDYVRRNH